jgi:signal-transduction protein with cAMP-binding, CBS, and nucleotidyltransferase domain
MHYGTDASVPVVRDRANPVLLGIITGRDIAVRCVARRHTDTCVAGDHMTPMPLYTLGPEDDIAGAAKVMEETEVRRIPIVTAEGVLVGIIRDLDLRKALRARESHRRRVVTARPRSQAKLRADRTPAITNVERIGSSAASREAVDDKALMPGVR